MKKSNIIRFALLGIAWLATVALLLTHIQRFTAYHAFVIVASAIIVFVPVYKKYVKNGNNHR